MVNNNIRILDRGIEFKHIKAIDKKNKNIDITKDISVMSLEMNKIYEYCYADYNRNEYIDYDRSIQKEPTKSKSSKKYNKYHMLGKEERHLLNERFSCKIPYSICLDYIYNSLPNEFASDAFGHQYTDLIINVTCKNPYKELSVNKSKKLVRSEVAIKRSKKGTDLKSQDKLVVKKSKNELRKFITTNGFSVNSDKYVYYKRSGSKARSGSLLFIKKQYKKQFELWSRMGIVFDDGEEVNSKIALAGILAYESLDMSHILPNHIYIEPKNILLIDDIEVFAPITEMLVTKLENGSLVTRKGKIKEKLTITDGQSLLDESVFNKYGYGDKGCCLLRQKMTKSCAFNTKVVEFMKEFYGDKYDTEIITDMLGRKIKVSDIRWIAAPSSFKFFKFACKFDGGKLDVYELWLSELEKMNNKFGVCKNEVPSSFGEYQQLSYQMLQALVLDKQELEELLKDQIDYYTYLRKDDVIYNYFKSSMSFKSSNDFIDNLCAFNQKAYNTQIYREKKNDTLTAYREDMRKGKILVKDTDYAIVVSDPVTMLYKAVGKNKSVSHGYEIYCKKYKNDTMLFETRNPVVCSANIGYVKNKWYDDYKWFNLTDNIAIITGKGNNLYTKNSGLDMDSDSILISSNQILVNKAKWCHNNFKIPCNQITQTEEDRNKKQYYTLNEIADVDYKISENFIGDVINTSQILNSMWQHNYYWCLKAEKTFNRIQMIPNPKLRANKFKILRAAYNDKKNLLDEILLDIAKCNDMSNIEIDKAKKALSVDSKSELMKIMHKDYINNKRILKKVDRKKISNNKYDEYLELVDELKVESNSIKRNKLEDKIDNILLQTIHAVTRPQFFEYITEKNESYNYERMNCTMDYLQEILDRVFTAYRGPSYTQIEEVLNFVDVTQGDRKHIPQIKTYAIECDSRIRSLKFLSKEEKKVAMTRDEIMEYFAIMLRAKVKVPTDETLKAIIVKGYCRNKVKQYYDAELYSVRNTLSNLLYLAYGEQLLKCFKNTGDGTIETLQEDEDGTIEILGKKYNKYKKTVSYMSIDDQFKLIMIQVKSQSVKKMHS